MAFVFLSGCGVPFRYYPQAVLGQMELFNRARPIDTMLKDPRVPERVRELLSEIPRVKAFGESQGLKATHNYVEYVELNRPAVVYVVSASAPLAFEAKRWNFPVVGGFTYLGWFSREQAERHASELRENEGLDVDVRGAGAYSTLGWFRDPVLSSMIPDGVEARAELVNVILHESVHATFYIDHQSAFNESLASFVADRLTESYFKQASESNLFPLAGSIGEWKDHEKRAARRRERLHAAYGELSAVYSNRDLSEHERLTRKDEILERVRADLKISPERTLNNATLIQFKTYFTGMEEFAALLDGRCGGDWSRFWKALEPLRQEPEKRFERRQLEDFSPVLRALAESKREGGSQ